MMMTEQESNEPVQNPVKVMPENDNRAGEY